jgi:SAM-dependent methyltransferase
LIAGLGTTVDVIDVAPPSSAESYYPVRMYDGRTLPFEDGCFDVVCSSNVLEHIPDLQKTLSEIQSVMKVNGLAVHILPTPAWRIWTSFSHYIHIAQRLRGMVDGRRKLVTSGQTGTQGKVSALGWWGMIKRVLLDGSHREYPSAISELWYFSRRRWLNMFNESGFELVEDRPSRVFYTGYGVLPSISIKSRRSLSRVIGSATSAFVLRHAT